MHEITRTESGPVQLPALFPSRLNRSRNRRQVLRMGGAGLIGAGTALLFGCGNGENESAHEVSRIRLPRTYTACMAPLLFAERYLRDDGIEVEYITRDGDYAMIDDVASGSIDMGYYFIPHLSHAIDAGLPIVMLGGAHTACYQIIATDDVSDLTDLRNRRVGTVVREPQPGDYSFLASILQRIGLSPATDVEFVPIKPANVLTSLGRSVDAIHCYAPYTFQLTDTNQGHVVLDSATDDPWDQYLCCAFFANRQFVADNPRTTKLALRAMLQAVDHCAQNQDSAAEAFVEKAWLVTDRYANRTLDEVPLDVWRTHDPEDSIRFYGLKLLEAGLIKSSPEEIIKRGTDWRLFNDLKEELPLVPGRSGRRLNFFCDTRVSSSQAGDLFANRSG